MNTKRILLVAAELAPLAPVGGVAEYVLGLGAALRRRGHDVRVALPAYAFLEVPGAAVVADRLVVPLGPGFSHVASVHTTEVECPGSSRDRLPIALLDGHLHFRSVRSAREIYTWPNHEPWVAFSRAVVEYVNGGAWQPDVIHCQDAHSALIPVYVKHLRSPEGASRAAKARTVLTIHNLLNQGEGPEDLVRYAGLPANAFHDDQFEHWGKASCFKAGMVAADEVTTVSSTYADEIRATADYGFGLEGVLRSLRRVTGIVNGIDEDRWRIEGLDYADPQLSIVAAHKQAARAEFFPRWGWEDDGQPVIAFRARWDHQKGVELFAECLPEILQSARVVTCVWGMPGGTDQLKAAWTSLDTLATERPDRLRLNPDGVSDVSETSRHYEVADVLAVPSRYEPCGLTQMECQRFGTVPLVRRTGGLADTVFASARPERPSPNGFVFENMTREDLVGAVRESADAFRNRDHWAQLLLNALRQANGWDTRIAAYEDVFGIAE